MQQTTKPERRIDTEEFVEWCERQIENSRCFTARLIVNDAEKVKFRIREGEREHPEDITLIKGKSTDTLRFEYGDECRQFHMHRRDVELCEKTLLVKSDGAQIASAGTGTKNKRGPFPL